MKKERTFWERMEEYPIGKLMLFVFLFGLSERLIVTLIFFLRWGFHTVSGIELWFYYGVAEGTFNLYSVWDPSWWILKVLGSIFRGQPLLYSVYLVSSISSSLNSALFCLLVSELHNKKTGFLAGLIYSSMVLPMFNSAGTVTHDIFGYPYLVLALYGVVMVFKRPGWSKLPFGFVSLGALFLGRQVGPTIYVGAGTIIIYLLWQISRALLDPRQWLRLLALVLTFLFAALLIYYGATQLFGGIKPAPFLVTAGGVLAYFILWQLIRIYFPDPARWAYLPLTTFLVITVGFSVLLHYEVMPPLMEKTFDLALAERGVDVRAQIRAGSGDLLASSLGDYWLRFNFLLFFLPIGLWVAFQKKDLMGLALIIAAFLASRAADRGTRPLTFGFALMGALAFVNWKSSFQWILVVWMGFIIGLFGGKYSTEYAVFFPMAALFIFSSVQIPRQEGGYRPSWILLFICLAWLVVGGILGGLMQQIKLNRTPATLEQMKIISKYWTIQLCLLVPVLLLVLAALLGRPGAPRGKKDRELFKVQQWLERGPVRAAWKLAVYVFFVSLVLVLINYIGLARESPLFPEGGILFKLLNLVWKHLHVIVPPAAGLMVFILVWPRRREETGKWLTGVAVVCWLFATIIPSMNQTAKSSEAEYRIYRWLHGNVSRTGKIFVPWSDGYLAEAVSGLPSELSPHNIDFVLPRLYWRPEEEANRELRKRGIEYILVSSKYFKLLAYNQKTGEFQYSFSPDIIYQPQRLGVDTITQLQETTLFKLLYRPRSLSKFKLLRLEQDRALKESFLVYQVLP